MGKAIITNPQLDLVKKPIVFSKFSDFYPIRNKLPDDSLVQINEFYSPLLLYKQSHDVFKRLSTGSVIKEHSGITLQQTTDEQILLDGTIPANYFFGDDDLPLASIINRSLNINWGYLATGATRTIKTYINNISIGVPVVITSSATNLWLSLTSPVIYKVSDTLAAVWTNISDYNQFPLDFSQDINVKVGFQTNNIADSGTVVRIILQGAMGG